MKSTYSRAKNDWTITAIKDVAVINRLTIDRTYKFNKIEYVDIASVENREIKNLQYLYLNEAPSRAKRIVRNNDILISTVRPNLKHYCFIRNIKENTIVSTGFAVITAIKADPYFLYYILTTDSYTDYLTKIADGHTSAYPSFNPEVIEDSKLPFPPLPEQKAIANVLSSLDDKIELLRKQNETLEAIAQTIFKEWFVNFNFPDKNGKPYKASGGKMVDSELGEIPEGWRVGVYEEIVTVSTGKGLKKEFISAKGKHSVLGANGALGKTDEYLFDDDLILTGRVGTLGTVNISHDKVWISDNVLISKAKHKEHFYFAYFTLQRFNFEALNRGSTQPLITQTDLKNVDIVIPSEGTLNQSSDVFWSIFKKMDLANGQIQILSLLRDTLLPKLMSGQVRVG